ncbi:hypothetical protein GGS20DRAFT_293737 [Poronia punctata]|nr:hypothetical protein GGS20DRAFT_293737 [Poronia punctata]
MPTEDLQYPTKPYSKVNRYDVRATYSLETIHQIVNTCPILHVSFIVPDSPFPMTLPMIGQMGSFARPSADTGDVLDLYLHGYVSSRLMNLSRNNNNNPDNKGFPLTISASHIDGLVLSLTPNSHSYNYRSATLFGHAVPVTDVSEKLYAMQLITDSVVRDRYRNTRVPPNGAEMQSTTILRVAVETGSAKVRSGMPSDEKGDLEDGELCGRVWTGVVPVSYRFGEPLGSGYNKVEEVPGYLKEYVGDTNRDWEEGAVEAAGKSMKGKKGKGKGEE